jgi:hypothetical protein
MQYTGIKQSKDFRQDKKYLKKFKVNGEIAL